MNKIILCTLVTVAFSSAHAGLFSKNKTPDNTLGIRFEKNVPDNQKNLMNKDLNLIKSLTVEDPSQEIAHLFKMAPTASNYEAWLAQRSRYVVSEDFKLDSSRIKVLKASYTYPNSIMPDLEKGITPVTGGNVKVVMSNIGGALYMAGKQSGSLFGVDLKGIGVITANSPRMGLFKIGEGHFLPLMRRQNSTDFESYANSLNRLATFFHEARHSDGNAKSLSFVHAVCPAGHNYAGYNACDKSLNGPYTIGAAFLKSIANSCVANNCSEAEKETLRNVYMDSYSRVMKIIPKPAVDPSIAATLKDSCDLLRRLKASGASNVDLSFCDAPAAPGATADGIQATDWDDTPEIGAN